MVRTIKVAVVGSGLAGLTSAWLLTRSMKKKDVEFEVHIFEKVQKAITYSICGVGLNFSLGRPMC